MSQKGLLVLFSVFALTILASATRSQTSATEPVSYKLKDGSTLVVRQGADKAIDFKLFSPGGALSFQAPDLDDGQIKNFFEEGQMKPDGGSGGANNPTCDQALSACRIYVGELETSLRACQQENAGATAHKDFQ